MNNKLVWGLLGVSGMLICCDVVSTIQGLQLGLQEVNPITLIFMSLCGGAITGLIISSIVKFIMLMSFILIDYYVMHIPYVKICTIVLCCIMIATTAPVVMNNIILIRAF